MEPLNNVCAAIKKQRVLLEESFCSRCGQKFKSPSERIALDDQRWVCSACYNRLAFPEIILRCPE